MSNDLPPGCAFMIVGAFIAGSIGFAIAANGHREEHVFTVDSKERQCDGGEHPSCYYVIFGTKGEVFENRDSGILNGKWDSATMQARFKVGHTYRVETVGWRVPIMSWKPNIVAMSEVRP